MRKIRLAALALLMLGLTAGGVVLYDALAVATGYSAKQLCSGVMVANLPEDFVIERDIEPRMAILGPAYPMLKLEVDAARGRVSASLLGVSAEALHLGPRGCVLHGEGEATPPQTLAGAPAPEVRDRALDGALDRAFAEPEGGGRNTLAVLVARNGKLLTERYAAPVTARTPLQSWSMNKSLMATWIGMQVERGALDLSLAAAEIARAATADPSRFEQLSPQLTLAHLLQMESGLAFEESYGPGSDVTRMLYRTEAMWQVPASLGHDFAPGTHFSYSSGDTNFASMLWQRSLGAMPYYEWIEREFTRPLGLSGLTAEPDASGVQVGSSYTYMTGRDWLRVGQMWLDAWHGRPALVSQDWQRAAVAPRTSDARGRYGRGFWLNTGRGAFPSGPESLFYAGGNAGQYVLVLPEQELVIVRLGLTDTGVSEGVDPLIADTLSALGLAPD